MSRVIWGHPLRLFLFYKFGLLALLLVFIIVFKCVMQGILEKRETGIEKQETGMRAWNVHLDPVVIPPNETCCAGMSRP